MCVFSLDAIGRSLDAIGRSTHSSLDDWTAIGRNKHLIGRYFVKQPYTYITHLLAFAFYFSFVFVRHWTIGRFLKKMLRQMHENLF